MMAKGNRQRAALAKRAKVQARAAVETQGDKFLKGFAYAAHKAECIATYEAHKSAQVMVQDGIIARHW